MGESETSKEHHMTSITSAPPVASTAAATTAAPAVNMETFANLAVSGDALQSAMGATLDEMFSKGGPGAHANATSMTKLHLQTSELELSTTLLTSMTSSLKNQVEKMANSM
jgi:hypothetical protein